MYDLPFGCHESITAISDRYVNAITFLPENQIKMITEVAVALGIN
jgi:hypothetical protein